MSTALPPWHDPLNQALTANQDRPDARYLQLATLTPQGPPANRTVVFRGFWDTGHTLLFISDLRSPKITQIHHYPWGAACWYFPLSWEQFRLTGSLAIVDAGYDHGPLLHHRQVLWQRLSDTARQQFMGPPPGQPLDQDSVQNRPSPLPTDPQQPPLHFCLVLLSPTEVDYLQLQGSPHRRYRYERHDSGDWSKQPITP